MAYVKPPNAPARRPHGASPLGVVVSPERFGVFPLLAYDYHGSGQKVSVFRDRAAHDY